MRNFVGRFGERSEERNLSVEMCREGFVLEHALTETAREKCAHVKTQDKTDSGLGFL